MKNEMFYGEEATFETLDELKAALKPVIKLSDGGVDFA